jgi:hypothetical protein
MSACVPLWLFAASWALLLVIAGGLVREVVHHGKTEMELDALRTRLNMTGKTDP